MEKLYKIVTRKSNDPSLRIKYSYAMDFISGIGGTKYEKWFAAQRLLDAAFIFAFMSIFAGDITKFKKLLGDIAGDILGIFKVEVEKSLSNFQTDIQSNKKLQDSREELLLALKNCQPNDCSLSERWYDRVNVLRMAETLAIEEVFDKIYSVNCYEKHSKDESVTYFSAKLLVDIVADKKRK